MTQHPDKLWLADAYAKFIWTIQNHLTTTIPINDQFFVFYVSNGRVQFADILRYMTANNQNYYYNFKYVSARDSNPPFNNLLIYDFSLAQNDALKVNALTWDGSHINIAPDFKNVLLDYHYTIYNADPLNSNYSLDQNVAYPRNINHSHYLRNRIQIDHDYCRLSIPEWYYNNNPICVNEGYRFNNIRGKLLRPGDGRNILNSALPPLIYPIASVTQPPQQYGGAKRSKQSNTLTQYFKIIKPTSISTLKLQKEITKINILPKRTDSIIHKYGPAVCKYVEALAKKEHIKLEHNSVIIFNPHKSKEQGVVILNCNIHLDPYTNSVQKTSKTFLKGYFKKEITTSDINELI